MSGRHVFCDVFFMTACRHLVSCVRGCLDEWSSLASFSIPDCVFRSGSVYIPACIPCGRAGRARRTATDRGGVEEGEVSRHIHSQVTHMGCTHGMGMCSFVGL